MYSMNRTSAPMARRVLEQRHDLIVVRASQDHAVDFDVVEVRTCGVDPGQHARQLLEAGERLKAVCAQGVEADGDPVQTGVPQRSCEFAEQHAVRRERQVVYAGARRELANETWQITAEQRFAPGEADSPHAERRKDGGEAHDLLELQDVLSWQPDVLLLRHAVPGSAGCSDP